MKDKMLDMPLGDRMKYYESIYELEVKPEQHIVVRCDGHKFSKFTRGFEKPFDDLLSKAMELVAMDLLTEFDAVTVYHQSDEITIIIPSLKDKTIDNRKSLKHKLHKCVRKGWTHGYSGRTQKMASLIAGFTTMRFNKHLEALIGDYKSDLDYRDIDNIFRDTHKNEWDYYKTLLSKLGNAWFDCRVYGVDSDEEAFNSVLWRVRDAEKNSRSIFAQTYCSHKQLQKKTGKEQVEFCKEKTGKDWETIDDRYKYGILVKKEKYLKIVEMNQYQNATDVGGVERTRVYSFSKHLTYSKENVELIMAKSIFR